MADTGWLLPRVTGTHAGHSSIGLGTAPWYATPYIGAIDGQASYISGSAGGNLLANQQLTEWLRAEDFRPTIPVDAVITGMSVRYFIRRTAGDMRINAICLRQGGQYYAGSVKRPTQVLTSNFLTFEYGGVFDKWAVTPTRAMLMDPTFGFVLQCKSVASGSNVAVDYVQVKYHYTTSTAIKLGISGASASAIPGRALAKSSSIIMPTAGAAASAVLRGVSAQSVVISLNTAAASASSFGVTAHASTYFRYMLGTAGAAAGCVPPVLRASSVYIALKSSGALCGSIRPGLFFSSFNINMGTVGALASAVRPKVRIRNHVQIGTAGASASADLGKIRVVWRGLTLYPDFLRNSQQSIVLAWPVLVTISHPQLAQPERFTNAGIPIESRGNLFEAIPFDVRFPTSGRNQVGEGALTLPLQSRRVRGTYRALPEPRPIVTIEMVSGDDPDTVVDVRTLRMESDQTGNGVMTIVLSDGDFERRQFPPLRFDGRWAAVHD